MAVLDKRDVTPANAVLPNLEHQCRPPVQRLSRCGGGNFPCATYFRSLARSRKPEGQVVIVDFHRHGLISGLLGHGTAKEEVRREMDAADYQL